MNSRRRRLAKARRAIRQKLNDECSAHHLSAIDRCVIIHNVISAVASASGRLSVRVRRTR